MVVADIGHPGISATGHADALDMAETREGFRRGGAAREIRPGEPVGVLKQRRKPPGPSLVRDLDQAQQPLLKNRAR